MQRFGHLLLIALATIFCGGAQAFDLATFEVDVTVPMGHALMGGGIEPAKEVVDPLFAKGIILLGGAKPLVWCSVDWCEIRNDAYAEWRQALADAVGTDPTHVMLAAIHQHDTPVADFTAQAMLDAAGLEKSLCDVAFVRDCIARTAAAAKEALQRTVTVTDYGLGEAEVLGVASNRRVVASDGSVNFSRTSSTPDPVVRNTPAGLHDPMLKTLSFWNGRKPVAAMSFYAVHPMSYYGKGGVSADFPGMARAMRQADLPDVKQIYFSGCSGDLVAGKYNDAAPARRMELALRLHAAMTAAWNTTVRYPLETISVNIARLTLPLRETEAFDRASQEQVLNDAAAKPFQRNLAAMGLSWRKHHAERPEIEAPAIDFGQGIFVLMPAESFVEYQIMAQRMRPDRMVFVAGYGESAPGYIPSRHAVDENFIPVHDWCWVAPPAPEAMRDALHEALGTPEAWAPLPEENAAVSLPAQSWDHRPGSRTIEAHVYYPGGERSAVNAQTGLILTLHNWGGTGSIGAPDPQVLADAYNLVAITVDYLQSGPYDSGHDAPYDHGYLQALDALRALHFVYSGLQRASIAFDAGRIYASGGSGGGNVSLMANKLAPRTFTAIIDLSGMARLSDDVAFNFPAGSELNAGYSRDPRSPRYLHPDGQLLRDLVYLPHLLRMKELGNNAKIVTVHGVEDTTCPFEDKRDMVDVMGRAGLDVVPHFIDAAQVDNEVFTDAAHSLGDRTRIVQRVADTWLNPASATCLRRQGPNDFDLRDGQVRYEGPTGAYIIGYEAGYPVGRFELRSDFQD
ncbi:MAG: DUF2920 family protein [Candidatus Hydrogenedentes bacterium]|nr:DUF2920 family protein [Candidatus Hydrogenedentota bacterium]